MKRRGVQFRLSLFIFASDMPSHYSTVTLTFWEFPNWDTPRSGNEDSVSMQSSLLTIFFEVRTIEQCRTIVCQTASMRRVLVLSLHPQSGGNNYEYEAAAFVQPPRTAKVGRRHFWEEYKRERSKEDEGYEQRRMLITAP